VKNKAIKSKRVMDRTQAPKKAKTAVPDHIQERIVQVSLLNLELGPQRLVRLLEPEGICVSPSKVYTILRRNGLQNRTLRLLKVRERNLLEEPPLPEVDMPAAEKPYSAETPPVPGSLPSATAEAKPAQPKAPIVRKVPVRRVRNGSRLSNLLSAFHFFNLLNIALVVLIIFLGLHAWQLVRKAGSEPEIHAVKAPPTKIPTLLSTAIRPLSDYRIISQRNLFASQNGEAPASREAVDPDIRPAPDLGFKLVGTVVAKTPEMCMAFIEDRITGRQYSYRQRGRIGQSVIRKILRGQIVINTGGEDMLLSMGPEHGKDSLKSAVAAVDPVQLRRKEIESTFPDYMQLMRTVSVRPHFERGQPGGILVYNIQPESILAKMGLEDGDVITAVNGEPTSRTQQAEDFYYALVDGGNVTVQIKRGETTPELRLEIN